MKLSELEALAKAVPAGRDSQQRVAYVKAFNPEVVQKMIASMRAMAEALEGVAEYSAQQAIEQLAHEALKKYRADWVEM